MLRVEPMHSAPRASISRAPIASMTMRSTASCGTPSRGRAPRFRSHAELPFRNMSEQDDRSDSVIRMTRRELLASSAALGAALAWPRRTARAATAIEERRDLFPEGVASGDPHPDSVLLWTRRPPVGGSRAKTLRVDVATDAEFHRVISTATAKL